MQRYGRFLFTPVLPLGKDGRLVTGSREHIELSKNAAREGMVLLKNEGQVLPLAKGTRVALFGKATFDYVKGGGGSGDVTCAYVHNIYDGLSADEDILIYQPTADYYRNYWEEQNRNNAATTGVLGMKTPGLMPEAPVPADLIPGAAAYADVAIISISRYSGEGWDRTVPDVKQSEDGQEYAAGRNRFQFVKILSGIFEKGDFYLSRAEEALVEAVASSFKKVVVLMNVGGMVPSGSKMIPASARC